MDTLYCDFSRGGLNAWLYALASKPCSEATNIGYPPSRAVFGWILFELNSKFMIFVHFYESSSQFFRKLIIMCNNDECLSRRMKFFQKVYEHFLRTFIKPSQWFIKNKYLRILSTGYKLTILFVFRRHLNDMVGVLLVFQFRIT